MGSIRIVPSNSGRNYFRKKKQVYNWIESMVQQESKTVGTVLINLCSDDELLVLNQKYLGHNDYTDIITFDYSENQEVSGELFISEERVDDNANKNEVSEEQEMLRVIIHGIFHLCGYKDKTDSEKKEMRKKENAALNKFVV